MPYIVHDEESGRFFHVSLSGPSLDHIDKLLSATAASEANEPRAPVSATLEEAIAQAEALALAREEDSHTAWQHLNEGRKP